MQRIQHDRKVPERFTITLTELQYTFVQNIANLNDLSAADWLRWIILQHSNDPRKIMETLPLAPKSKCLFKINLMVSDEINKICREEAEKLKKTRGDFVAKLINTYVEDYL